MVPLLHAWQKTPTNQHFTASLVVTRQANQGFSHPGKVHSSKEKLYKETGHEMFHQNIQITMEYNERDVSNDEQIVEQDKNKDNTDEEPGDESADERDDEPEEEEGQEKNPWIGIPYEIKKWQKEKLEALMTAFQKVEIHRKRQLLKHTIACFLFTDRN